MKEQGTYAHVGVIASAGDPEADVGDTLVSDERLNLNRSAGARWRVFWVALKYLFTGDSSSLYLSTNVKVKFSCEPCMQMEQWMKLPGRNWEHWALNFKGDVRAARAYINGVVQIPDCCSSVRFEECERTNLEFARRLEKANTKG
jgi:hypothetical protein